MGLIQRLFGKKEVREEPVRVELTFSEVVEWSRSHYEEVFGGLEDHIQDCYAQLADGLKELQEVKKDLAGAGISNEVINRRLVKAGRSNRDNLLKNIDILSDKAKVPQDPSPRVALEFTAEFRSLLDTFFENTLRSQQYVKALFPEEYRLTMDCMNRINSLLEDLSGRLKGLEGKLVAYGQLEGMVNEFFSSEGQVRSKREEISSLEVKSGDIEVQLKDLAAQLDLLQTSGEMERVEELERTLAGLEEKIHDVDSRARGLISPLSKAMERMEKQDQSGRHVMAPQTKDEINSIRQNAVYVLNNDITALLQEIRLRVESNDLGLKEQKVEGTLKQIYLLNNSDALLSLKQERNSLLEQVTSVRGELETSGIYGEIRSLEESIKALTSKHDSTVTDLASKQHQLESLVGERDGLKLSIKTDMEKVFGYTFVID